MPLLHYFAWVEASFSRRFLPRTGAALRPLPLRHLPTFRSIRRSTSGSTRIRNGLNEVVFDATRSTLPPEVDQATDTGPGETLAQAERQPFDAFAEMVGIPVRPCFRPPCSAGHAAEHRRPAD